MEKCLQVRKHRQVHVHDLDLFVTVQLLEDTLAVLSLGKLCEEHGYSYKWPMVKSPIWPQMGKYFCARRQISFFLSQDCLQARAQVRLPHRYRRTHRLLLWVQQDHVTILTLEHRETEAILQKSTKRKDNNEATIRVIGGFYRVVSKIQRCQHSQTLLMFQIRNVLRKWQPGSAVLKHISRKIEIARSASEPRLRGLFAGSAWRSSTSGRKNRWLDNSRSQSSQWGWWISKQSQTTQWIQSYPCNTEASQETDRSLRMFFEPSEKPKVIYIDIHWNLANPM